MREMRSIQVLRGIAAMAVVTHHAYRLVDPNSFARVGAAGVDLFFVISGFIMATVGPGRRPGEFIADRLWRIVPMWLIAVAPWLISAPHDRETLLTSLTLWPIWNDGFHLPALMVGWTLCFEMLFYFAFAVALAWRPAVPLALFGTCVVLSGFVGSAVVSYLGSPMIAEFLAGVAIAQLRPHRHGSWMVIVGFAWFALAPVDYYMEAFGYGAFMRVLAWGIPAALVVHGARSLEPMFDRRAFYVPVLIGNASFSIYLFHRMVVAPGVPWPLAIIAAGGVGVGVYWLIERRIMALRPRSHQRHATSVAADASARV